ncbi:MAG: hypothetical protein FWD28_01765 [Treponema sp.]|nr:hypothetical protein [Treponema sp.]
MKKYLFIVVIMLFGFASIFANPLEKIQGIVSYSESTTVFFDSEANAMLWIETQDDFMSQREAPALQRRIFAAAMENLIPNMSMIVTLGSDFCVMITRVPNSGQSCLVLFVRGEITKLWQY